MYMNDAQGSIGINETNYWTLFGDPSLEIRTDQPTALNISHDGAIVVGQTELSVTTDVDNALAALSLNGELLAFAYSENGSASLDLSDIELLPGDYDLVVTSFNAFPYETTVSVITPDGPKGPAKELKPGAVKAAMRTGSVILPTGSYATKHWASTNWDTFYVAKPFGKIHLLIGKPLAFSENDDFDECSNLLKNKLDRLEEEAKRRAAV
jgi:hypothetical protein